MAHEDFTEDSVLRRSNRALRTINRQLRRRVEHQQQFTDALFLALCEQDDAAEQAMRELWERGGFDGECSPGDFEYMVEKLVRARALTVSKVSRPQLSAVPPRERACLCGTSRASPGWFCCRAAGHEGPCAAHPLHITSEGH